MGMALPPARPRTELIVMEKIATDIAVALVARNEGEMIPLERDTIAFDATVIAAEVVRLCRIEYKKGVSNG